VVEQTSSPLSSSSADAQVGQYISKPPFPQRTAVELRSHQDSQFCFNSLLGGARDFAIEPFA